MDYRSGSITSTTSSSQQHGNNSGGAPGSVTTLQEAASVFEAVSSRANRCSLQLATYRAHEQQFRRFLLEKAVPAADSALKERASVQNRHEEDYGNAQLRLKGVSSPMSATRRRIGGSEIAAGKVTDDPGMVEALDALKGYSARYGKQGAQ